MFCIFTNICNAQFSTVYNSLTELREIFCLNKDTVYVCSTNGILLSTFNGGNTWKRDSLPTTATFNSIYMQKNGKGIVVGDNGTVFKTNQFGNVWYTVQIGTSSDLGDVKMVNDSTFFILMDYGFYVTDPVKKTGCLFYYDNKKLDSIYTNTLTRPFVNEYKYFGKDSILVIVDRGIYTSINHGLTWTQKQNSYVSSIDMKNFCSGYVGRDNYLIYKTTDTCANLSLYQQLTNQPPVYEAAERDVQFLFVIDYSTTYIAGSNACCGPSYSYIAKTADGGITWERRKNDIYPIDMQMMSSDLGYLIDNRKVYKIANGCLYEDCRMVTGVENNSLNTSLSFSIFPNPTNESATITSKLNIPIYFELYNQLGVLVEKHSINTSQYEIQKANKQAGCYFYKIKSDKNELLQTGKLIIE